ncbi:hypothetical protein D3C87_162360 [compost metagenome]
MESLPLDSLSSLSVSSLIAGILFSIVGLWVFRQGRKAVNIRLTIVGLLMMIYPYFVDKPLLTWGIGCVLCGYSYYTWDI